MFGSLSTSHRNASRLSFRPRLEALEDRALPSGLAPLTQPVEMAPLAQVRTISMTPVFVQVTNTKTIATQPDLTPHDITQDVKKAIPSANEIKVTNKTTEPAQGKPVESAPPAKGQLGTAFGL